LAGESILLIGGAGLRIVLHTDANGEFFAAVPYGYYRLSVETKQAPESSTATIVIAPLETMHVELFERESGAIVLRQSTIVTAAGTWTDGPSFDRFPEAFSFQGVLLSREPLSVTAPLDFTGLSDNRLAVESQRAFSWTDTQYKLDGLDATDSYQPGFPAILPDLEALDSTVVRDAFSQISSSSDGTESAMFLSEARFAWHGSLSTADSGASLSSTNLPSPPNRGILQQTDQYRWLTRDHSDVGGPLGNRVDFFASASGQWASQTEPLATPGTDQRSRLLFGNTRGRVRASATDRFDALFSGSRINLTDGGIPAGLEALTGNRMAPSFILPGGFSGQSETDHLDFVQVGWTHVSTAASPLGTIEARYGYSIAHLDTDTQPLGQSRIELLGGIVSGAPPLANLAVRSRQEIEAVWLPQPFHVSLTRHQMVAGGGWKTSEPRNRFSAPSDMNLITANGAPAFVMEFNTPLDSREQVRSLSAFVADHVVLTSPLSVDLGALADFSRGSLPAQSSPSGAFVPVRVFVAQPDLIVWKSLSPRAGFAWRAPHSHGLVLRGAYSRLYGPLAGRYLDFGNPNSLGGSTYQWLTPKPSAPFELTQQGALLLRFGGPDSSISPHLRRPYSDEFNVGAEYSIARDSVLSLHLYRRDDKNRIAAIDTGVPAQAFTPVSILDPGPDGIPSTFDDQRLTVYAQNPATFGQDRYLLTNPAGLRMLNEGLAAEIRTRWRRLALHASFVAEKSFGPTNPGDAFYENDPGVTGALFLDPNTTIHATGHSFIDRAFVGKIQAIYQLPAAWGGIELASLAVYTDGLVFARQLLVDGLPQGPLLVATTVRGSPEGGNRAQYAINWNVRLARTWALPIGRLEVLADILNVSNAGQRLQENDLSGPLFNQRLPVTLQPPRFVRLGFRYDF
jgi:hypothetical protein